MEKTIPKRQKYTKISHQERFYSCSIDELKGCIKARVNWVREYRRFRKSSASKEFSHISAHLVFEILLCKQEISWISQQIRLLKEKGCKNLNEYIARLTSNA